MQITTFRMIYLTFVNEYDPWPGAPTFRTFQLPELIADTLTAGLVLVSPSGILEKWKHFDKINGTFRNMVH